MSLEGLESFLRHLEVLQLGEGGNELVVPEVARAVVLASLARRGRARPLVAVVPTGSEAEHLAADLEEFLGGDEVELYPAWETLPFERISPTTETMGRRLRVAWRLLGGGDRPAVIVASIRSLLQILPDDVGKRGPIRLEKGSVGDPEELVRLAVSVGYRREYQVEHRGEVARRGGIVDIYPSVGDEAYRLEFFGDEVERISVFDPEDQRSREEKNALEIYPARELIAEAEVRTRASEAARAHPWGEEQFRRIAQGELFDGMEPLLPWLVSERRILADLLDEEASLVLCDPERLQARARDLSEEEAGLAQSLAQTWGLVGSEELEQLHEPYSRLGSRTMASVWSMPSVPSEPHQPAIEASAWGPGPLDPSSLARRLGDLARSGWRVVVTASSEAVLARFVAGLAEEGLQLAKAEGLAQLPPGTWAVVSGLERGFLLPAAKLAVIAEGDLTNRRRPHRPPRKRKRPEEGFFDALAPGDYVVHHIHGVGIYRGMVKMSTGGGERDYLAVEYKGGDKLYVPSDQIDLLTPYTGGETPTLHRLGGSDFARTKARVRRELGEIAEELVSLYRARQEAKGHAFSPDTPWQAEMEAAFPYEETPDQLKAIREVKADMEGEIPMDRLVCGDVGFGKTEVAIRAAFKAVQDGYQVAVLVPTTILANQHYETFSERFAPYPVRVEVLSRFLSPQQARSVIDGLARGSVDVVIGTHRLLSPDVKFAKLGLLVVDEEQRFGVIHKEAIKRLSVGVDVLTLTASPIPRTLEMALVGIRDLTLLETPPQDRQPILTYVGPYDERAVAEAIRRELLREGQVFFVHNRVADIDHVAGRIRELVPEAKVGVAHGQMDEAVLERMVLDFSEGHYDVLVCTTIIESGIDMPQVNTLIVDRAHTLGLGQLHQLRGRVGRSGLRAYAYLFYPAHANLSEEAYERLRTIGEHTELGAGFKIALRDLEIRGAGNLLGKDQSGHIAAVGYDLYVKMVAEAVAREKGEVPEEPSALKLDLPVVAHIPSSYIEKEDLRLEAYRRVANLRLEEEIADLEAEWRDRFGPLPAEVAALLEVAKLRVVLLSIGAKELSVTRNPQGAGLVARCSPVELPLSAQVRLRRLAPRAIYKQEAKQLVFPLRSDDVVGELNRFLAELTVSQGRSSLSSPPPLSEARGEGV